MSRLNVTKLESMVDELNRDQMLTLLDDIADRWPVTASQTDTTRRHFESLDLKRQLMALPEDANAAGLEDHIRMFLRAAAESRPHRAIAWFSLVGAE